MGNVHITNDRDHEVFVFIRDQLSSAAALVTSAEEVEGVQLGAKLHQYWPPRDSPDGKIVGTVDVFVVEGEADKHSDSVPERTVESSLAKCLVDLEDGESINIWADAGDPNDEWRARSIIFERASPGCPKLYFRIAEPQSGSTRRPGQQEYVTKDMARRLRSAVGELTKATEVQRSKRDPSIIDPKPPRVTADPEQLSDAAFIDFVWKELEKTIGLRDPSDHRVRDACIRIMRARLMPRDVFATRALLGISKTVHEELNDFREAFEVLSTAAAKRVGMSEDTADGLCSVDLASELAHRLAANPKAPDAPGWWLLDGRPTEVQLRGDLLCVNFLGNFAAGAPWPVLVADDSAWGGRCLSPDGEQQAAPAPARATTHEDLRETYLDRATEFGCGFLLAGELDEAAQVLVNGGHALDPVRGTFALRLPTSALGYIELGEVASKLPRLGCGVTWYKVLGSDAPSLEAIEAAFIKLVGYYGR
jgi:hypothetical protein